jgi:hypothetical protein
LIYWNNLLVGSIDPSDYNIHTFAAKVVPKSGTNNLTIIGSGISDSFGLTIDDVRLNRENKQ